jgi:hypothetical protein
MIKTKSSLPGSQLKSIWAKKKKKRHGGLYQ